MSTTLGLSSWLATLDTPRLQALLRARPDAALPPEPRDLGELAARLSSEHSTVSGASRLSRPALQVAEALLALGGTAARADLLRLLGAVEDTTVESVELALQELFDHALAWPSGDHVRLAAAWSRLLPNPLGLGAPGRELYGQLTVAQLERIGPTFGLGGPARKSDWVDAICAAAADPATVGRRLEHAGPAVAEAVRTVAASGPYVSGLAPIGRLSPVSDRVEHQLVVQGWVVVTAWGNGEMPREVALAVRGPGYHAPFHPLAPRPPAAAVDPERVRRAGEQQAGAALDRVRRLVSSLDRSPLATVRSGGVGVRELRRAAKQLGADDTDIRLWLEIAAGAVLVAPAADEVLATTTADEWLAADPADALARLLLAWWQLPVVPTRRVDESGRPAASMQRSFAWREPQLLRAAAVGALSDLGHGRGLVHTGTVAQLLAYRAPRVHCDPDLEALVNATFVEAERLGLVADGALTGIGSHLLDAVHTADPQAALSSALAGVLPATSRTATFLPDLTVVVTGSAAAPLARLLDDAADAESRDAASTWRFTPESIRRALDGGRTADELLTALTAVADNALPQPLEYLVRDIARNHGRIQVFAVASCIRVSDSALGSELIAHSALVPLRLRMLADTVLASSQPVGDTLVALRKAGYAPVRQDGTGTTVVERAPVRRSDPGHHVYVSLPEPSPGHAAADPDKLAARLTGLSPARAAPVQRAGLHPEEVPLLGSAEAAVLSHAIASKSPVLITYVNAAGNESERVIEPRMKLLGTLVAWCRTKRGDRNFALERIRAVSPVAG